MQRRSSRGCCPAPCGCVAHADNEKRGFPTPRLIRRPAALSDLPLLVLLLLLLLLLLPPPPPPPSAPKPDEDPSYQPPTADSVAAEIPGMVGTAAHLPSVTAVSVDILFLVVMVCLLVEVVAGIVMWKTSRVTRCEAAMVSQRQTLRAGVAKTNYTSTFVENSKLKRLLLKVEKDLERIQSAKERRNKAATKAVRAVRVCVYGSMVVLMWGRPLISFSPDYLWPSCFSHALSGGRTAGSVGALSIVAMFVFGLVPRFSPTG